MSEFRAELLGMHHGETCAIAVRRTVGAVGVEAVQAALGAAAYYETDGAVVVTNSVFTLAAMQLAEKAGLTLIDRAAIKEWLRQLQHDGESARVTAQPHQQLALDRLQEIRKEGGLKALVVMASGLGKTYVAAFD